jgi:hypothetical protein
MKNINEVAEEFGIAVQDIRDRLRPTMWCELEDQFEAELNDMHGLVEVCGYRYESGAVMRAIDPIAFQEECSNYWDANDDVYAYDPASTDQEYYSLYAIEALAADSR